MKDNKLNQLSNESDVSSPQLDGKSTAVKVGIDLGTSRSAITTSKGERMVMASVVGWPKDAISAKVFGHRVLVGDAVLENRMGLKICFPLADGNLAFTQNAGDQKDC